MSIIRAPRPEANFYMLNKSISEDGRLSWAARGLLVFLLGKPDHWAVSVTHLRNETAKSSKPTGRDGVYGLLQELIAAGYVERRQDRGESGLLAKPTTSCRKHRFRLCRIRLNRFRLSRIRQIRH